jgi:hypothetical protein
MKSLIALACLFAALISVPAARAQDLSDEVKERLMHADMSKDELPTLERENVRALQQRNLTFFHRIYSDDFVGVSASGRVMDKNAFLQAVQNSSILYSSFVVSDIRVRLYQDTAVVTCTWNTLANHEDHSIGQQFRVIHVYVYGQHGWQIVASQGTLLPG